MIRAMSEPNGTVPPDLDPVANPSDWDPLYAREDPDRLPWTWQVLDPDVAAALDGIGPLEGRVLDLGTGSGTQAIALARRGLEVVATDLSAAAIEKARRRAAEAGVTVDFRVDDILETELPPGFAAILDRGCFHVLAPESRPRAVDAMRRLLDPAGWLFLKTFSILQDGPGGPHRFTRSEILALFEPWFEPVAIADTTYQGTLSPFPKALFAVFRRVR
jgi:2-polyprenyl-3-methyl-5-hydroxy-6-metoxy-1,4-benzoquinol methylase